MARNTSGIFNEVFAEVGDKAPPDFPITSGYTPPYSIPVELGGEAIPRTTENFLMNQLYALGVDVNKMGGALQWDSSIQYDQYAYVVGSNGRLYSAVISNIGVDPVTDGGTNWVPLPTLPELANQTSPNEGTRLIGHTGETLFDKLGQIDSSITNVDIKAGAYVDFNGNILNSFNIASVTPTFGSPTYYDIVYTTPLTSNRPYISAIAAITSGTAFDLASVNVTNIVSTGFRVIVIGYTPTTTLTIPSDFSFFVFDNAF